MQETVVDEQVKAALAEEENCRDCGARHGHKDTRTIVLRTLFGTLRLRSPRWLRCRCQAQPTATFSPLAALLPERTTPELAYLEAKFAGLVSYGLSARLLAEVLPLGRHLHASEVRRRTHAVAGRLEDELGPEPGLSIV
ncbi:MAG: ISKra4 family transposase, partial [Acidimicrobiales bacterium]